MRTILFIILASLTGTVLHAQLLRFQDNYKVGYKDASGKKIVAATYDAGSDFKEGFAVIMKGGKRGYINAKGEEVIAAQYDDASLFEGGLACVEQNGKWGYINPSGGWAILPIYDNAFSFRNGLARVCKGSKWGMIDAHGVVRIPLIYTRLYDLTDGTIASSMDEQRYGYLSADGKVALDFTFLSAQPFDEQTHKAIVCTARGSYYINKRGALLEKVVNKEEEEERERREGQSRKQRGERD